MISSNPLEGELTSFDLPEASTRVPEVIQWAFDSSEEAAEYIGRRVDVPVRERQLQVARGIQLAMWPMELDHGQFTNVYEVTVNSTERRPQLAVSPVVRSVGSVLHSLGAVAASSGGFLFLADRGRPPRQSALNLAWSEHSTVLSLPVVDREALLVKDGKLSGRPIRALGAVVINGRELTWGGSLTEHERDITVFGNGNAVINHQIATYRHARKQRIRVLDEASKYTPRIDLTHDFTDVGLLALDGGELLPAAYSSQGRLNSFLYDTVFRVPNSYLNRHREDKFKLRSIDDLPVDGGVEGAFSTGPMVGNDNLVAHNVNFDQSLGSDQPFSDRRMVHITAYETDDSKLHVRLYDGRPESPVFRGVTPLEATAALGGDARIRWGTFLDPGRTAKLCIRGKDGNTVGYGNAHYLRWPAKHDDPYTWVPGAGRPTPTALLFR